MDPATGKIATGAVATGPVATTVVAMVPAAAITLHTTEQGIALATLTATPAVRTASLARTVPQARQSWPTRRSREPRHTTHSPRPRTVPPHQHPHHTGYRATTPTSHSNQRCMRVRAQKRGRTFAILAATSRHTRACRAGSARGGTTRYPHAPRPPTGFVRRDRRHLRRLRLLRCRHHRCLLLGKKASNKTLQRPSSLLVLPASPSTQRATRMLPTPSM